MALRRTIAALVTSLALTATGAQAAVIQYDDGTAEQGWSIGSSFSVGVLFNNLPSSGSYLTGVSLDLGVPTTGTELQISVLDPNNGYISLGSFTPTFLSGSGFQNVSLPSILVGTSFLIAVHWDSNSSGIHLGYDTDSANNAQSFEYNPFKWPAPYWHSPPDPTGCDPTTVCQPDYGLWMIRADVNETPLPAALPLFATGLGAFGLLGWRRKKKLAALAA